MEAKLVRIVEVLSPDQFLLRVCSVASDKDEEDISREIRKYLEEKKCHSYKEENDYSFKKDDVCGLFKDDEYYRIVIKEIDGFIASCQFLDVQLPRIIVSIDKLIKLPDSIICQPGLVKNVKLKGVTPRSLLVMHNLSITFGPSMHYDECAHVFVSELTSNSSRTWICVAESRSFDLLHSFEALLYYSPCCTSQPLAKVSREAVFLESSRSPWDRSKGAFVSLSEAQELEKEVMSRSWFSLNQTLVSGEFACLHQSSMDDFVLYFTKEEGASSLKSCLPPTKMPGLGRAKMLRQFIKESSEGFSMLNVHSDQMGGSPPPPKEREPATPAKGSGRGELLRMLLQKAKSHTRPRATERSRTCTIESAVSPCNLKKAEELSPGPKVGFELLSEGQPITAEEDSEAQSFISKFLKMRVNSRTDIPEQVLPPSKADSVSSSGEIKSETIVECKSQDVRHNLGATENWPEKSQQKLRNHPRSKYNPMSQMVFKRDKMDVYNPCLVNNIVKVSPHEFIWLDTCTTYAPILRLREVDFYDLMKKDRHFSTVVELTALQSHAWPVIMNLLDFFGVGPSPLRTASGEKSSGGKTTSYLLPIVWQLNNTACYAGLPKGCNSPIVIIVCPSSRHVLDVFNMTRSLLSHQKDLSNYNMEITSSHLFGRCEEEKQIASARRGSHILVCTPNCLLRMFDRGATSFDNLCHLIFEEADILLNLFKPQIERIVDGFHLSVLNRKLGVAPQQLLVFSQHWTPELDFFVAMNQTAPTVAISTIMETFYSGNVKTELKICSSSSKFSVLLEILENVLSSSAKDEMQGGDKSSQKKIVMFCTGDEGAEQTYKWLLQYGIGWQTFLICDRMEDRDIELVIKLIESKETAGNMMIVGSDEVLLHLSKLSDITCVVHVDVPKRQHIMASRLFLMRDHFERTSTRAKRFKAGMFSSPRPEKAGTILLLTEEECEGDDFFLSNLATFLKRSGAINLPKEVAKERSGLSLNKLLCCNFKSFGLCSDHMHCKLRHVFSQKHDVDDLQQTWISVPFFSIVKIKVACVTTPFLYKAQVLEWVEQDGNGRPFPHNDAKLLALRLARQYGRLSNKSVNPESLKRGELFAWKTKDSVTYRVSVIQYDYQEEAQVYLVDLGDTTCATVTEMMELSQELKVVPYQALEVCVCRLKMVDQDPCWNFQDKTYVEKIIGHSMLTGRVVFRVGSTLWLDPLEECKKLTNLKVWTTTLDVRRAMLDKGLAEENPEHIQRLLSATNDITDLPEEYRSEVTANYGYSCSGLFLTTSVEKLQDKYTPVYLVAAENPHSFYVRKVANEEKLKRLHSDIEVSILVREIKWIGSAGLKKDVLVLAKDDNGRWRRGKVKDVDSFPTESALNIFFLDFGFTTLVERSDILPMPVRFKDALAFQAIECSFSAIEPYKPPRENLRPLNSKPAAQMSKRTVQKSWGSSVDPWNAGFDSDDDVIVDDPSDKTDGPSDKTDDPSDISHDISDKNDDPPEGEPLSWSEKACDVLLDATGFAEDYDLLTAVLIEPESKKQEESRGRGQPVHLYGYHVGDFVLDLGLVLIREGLAQPTPGALDNLSCDLSREMGICCNGDDAGDDDEVIVSKKALLNSCLEYIKEKDSEEHAKRMLDSVGACRDRGALKGLLGTLVEALKYSQGTQSIKLILLAVNILLGPKSLPHHDRCKEARSSHLWDVLCYHLYEVMSTSPEHVREKGRCIIDQLLDLLSCNKCTEGFVERGGAKGICHLLNNTYWDDECTVLCFCILCRLLCPPKASKEEKIEGPAFSEHKPDEPVSATSSRDSIATIPSVKSDMAILPTLSVSSTRISDFEEDEGYSGDFKTNEIISLFKSFFEQQSSSQHEPDSEEDEEEEQKDEKGVPPVLGFLRHHEVLNMGCTVMKNIRRNANFDLLECMDVVAMALGFSSRNVRLAAVYFLESVAHPDSKNLLQCVQRLRRAGGLEKLVNIVTGMADDSELLRRILYVLRVISGSSSYMRDHLRSLDLYNIVDGIHTTSRDRPTVLLSSELLQALAKRKPANTLSASTEMTEMKTEETPFRFGLAKVVPAIYWSNLGLSQLRMRVDARNVNSESLDVIYSEDNIQFKARSDITEYSFELQLFRPIRPLDCRAIVHFSEVIIFLSKRDDLHWHKLTPDRSFNVRPDLDFLEKCMKEEEETEKDPFADLPIFGREAEDDEVGLSEDEIIYD